MLDTRPAHAVFAPSSAHRWFECPGSIRLCADIPYTSSAAADEGTAAHTVAAHCLMGGGEAIDHLGEEIVVERRTTFAVTEAMCEGVQLYLDTVRAYVRAGYALQIETRLSLDHLATGQFGTADAILYHPDKHHLVVIDFKFGRNVVVDPEDNPQLLSYGSGAYRIYAFEEKVEQLTLVVVQPRAPGPPVRQWDLTPKMLHEFEIDFRQAVKEASEPDAPLSAGEWCRFCPASGICPEYRHLALRLAQAEFATVPVDGLPVVTLPDPIELPTSELGALLSAIDMIEDWIAAVRSHALKRALDGDIPVGHKLVRKNTLRRWVDEEKTARALTILYDLDPEQLWVRKLISPAQAEKLLPKHVRDALKPLIIRPDGDATLAPLHDKRPAIAVDAKKEFDKVLHDLQNSVALIDHDKPVTTENHDGPQSKPE